MESTRKLSISDLAGLLLDSSAHASTKKCQEIFTQLEAQIMESLELSQTSPVGPPAVDAKPAPAYHLASRLSRASYEDRARREAMVATLKKIHGSDRPLKSSGRIIRSQ